jgi:Uma2 family endonuclease
MQRSPVEHMTYAEYVARERTGTTKHEYLRGDVTAMAGGTPEHAALAASFARLLGNALEGKPCRVFSADLRIRVSATDLTTYPDLSVVCGKLETDAVDTDAVTNPVILVEVLSDSSEAYDRGAKAAHYRRIASLREYVLVSQHEPVVEVHRRNEQGHFAIFEYRLEDDVELTSVGAKLSVRALYANPLAS